MVAFPDRVEAQFTVPSGVTVSAATGAHTSAVTVTIPAGDYYLTEAGGVDSLIDTIETELNENVQGYPQSAASMKVACGGLPTWSAGWLFNITSGNDTGAFGGVTMTAASTPVYSNAGPKGGIDLAVSFDSAADLFSAGDNFDPLANDLVIAAVIKVSTDVNGDICGKGWGGDGFLLCTEAGRNLTFYVKEGADTLGASASLLPLDTWVVVMAVLERATNKSRSAWRALDGSSSGISTETDVTAIGSINAAGSFTAGVSAGYGLHAGLQIAGLYIGAGSGYATGVSTALATVLTNLAGAINAEWSVSIDTSSGTGRVTISNDWWPCYVDFTSTDARDALGFAFDFNYPTSAAQVALALGSAAEWEAGWLCNETSGNLSAAFGGVTLTAASTPVYSVIGPRGGADKAITFDSAADQFAAAASTTIDVGASEDLALLVVAQFSTIAGNNDIIGKGFSTGTGWTLVRETGSVTLYVDDGPDQVSASCAVAANTWYAILAVLERATNTMRVGVVPLVVSASPTVSTNTSTSAVGSLSNAAGLQLGAATAGYGAGNMTVAAVYVSSATGAATGLTSGMSTALSTFATYMKSQTGTQQARGVWWPDCPMYIDGDPEQAPLVTDRRATVSPTKALYALCSNEGYEHTGLVYSHAPRSQVWESEATYENGSWQTFARDCIFGLGHDWFTASSPLQFYWYDASAGALRLLGAEGNDGDGMSGWQIEELRGINPQRSEGIGGATLYFRIVIGTVVSDG